MAENVNGQGIRRGSCDRRVAWVVGGVVLLGATAAAIATGCYKEIGSKCSLFYEQPNDGCPDVFVVDFNLIVWDGDAQYEGPGRTGLDFPTCWCYIQMYRLVLGECEEDGMPILFGPHAYPVPVGEECIS